MTNLGPSTSPSTTTTRTERVRRIPYLRSQNASKPGDNLGLSSWTRTTGKGVPESMRPCSHDFSGACSSSRDHLLESMRRTSRYAPKRHVPEFAADHEQTLLFDTHRNKASCHFGSPSQKTTELSHRETRSRPTDLPRCSEETPTRRCDCWSPNEMGGQSSWRPDIHFRPTRSVGSELALR